MGILRICLNMSSPFQPVGTKTIFRFFGSVRLAMILLAILIAACVTGTLVETRLDTTVARAYVYDAPWFVVWLVLLCVNLIGSVLVRRPLKARHTGFVITHAGIVILLAGGIIDRIRGVEGMMTLSKGGEACDFLVLPGQAVEAHAPGSGKRITVPIDLALRTPSSRRPIYFKLGDVRVSAVGYADQLGVKTVVTPGSADQPPAFHVVMRSGVSQEPVERWLVSGDPELSGMDLGPARVLVLPEASSAAVVRGERVAGVGDAQSSREVQFAFSKMPDFGMVKVLTGAPTGVKALYRFQESQGKSDGPGVLELVSASHKFSMAVNDLLAAPVRWKGTDWRIRVLEYFPDFRMEGKKPVSISKQPNNPAVMFEIVGNPGRVTTGPDASTAHGLPDGHPSLDGAMPPSHPTVAPGKLVIYHGAGGKLRYESTVRDRIVRSGAIGIGKEFDTGLADWRMRVTEHIEHAVARWETAPVSGAGIERTGSPGLLVRVEKNGQSSTGWVAATGDPLHLDVAGEEIHVAFGQRLHPLPFRVLLEDFEVERNEGTQSPAGFKSRIRFIDPSSGRQLRREVWMNHPADFPYFPGVSLLGTAYKFSQSSWNPENLDETTLQVVKDPGWSLKWIGSLMLCCGIFMMFYLKGHLASRPAAAASALEGMPQFKSSLEGT